jgi:anti-sigma factor RsiW
MNCRQLVDLLADYESGELKVSERAQCEAHLHACARCAEYLVSYNDTHRLLRDAFANNEVSASPEDLVQKIIACQRGS